MTTNCPSVLLVPDGPGNPDIRCRCTLTAGHPHSSSLHRGRANGVYRAWTDAQAVQPPRGGVA